VWCECDSGIAVVSSVVSSVVNSAIQGWITAWAHGAEAVGPPQIEGPPKPWKENAVKAVFTNYAEIQAALIDIGSDSKQSLDTRVQANALA